MRDSPAAATAPNPGDLSVGLPGLHGRLAGRDVQQSLAGRCRHAIARDEAVVFVNDG